MFLFVLIIEWNEKLKVFYNILFIMLYENKVNVFGYRI